MSEDTEPAKGGTQEYLTAEEAAQELVTSLRGLRDATEGYVAAKKKLKEVGRHLTQLADATQRTGEKVVQAAEVIRSVSGPEILAEVHAAQGLLDSAKESLDVHEASVADAFAEQTRDRGETWQKQEAAFAEQRTDRAENWQKQEVAFAELSRRVRTVTYVAAASTVFAIAATVVALVR